MSINFTEKPEMNVVNVGDEISSDQLAAIQNASNPSASNPLATIADVGGGGSTGQPNFNWNNETNYGYNNVWGFEYGILGNYNPVWIIADVDTYTPYITMLADGSNGAITYSATGITFPDGSFQATATTGTSDQTLNTVDTVTFAGLNLVNNGYSFEVNPDSGYASFKYNGNTYSSLDYTGLSFGWGFSGGSSDCLTSYNYDGITFPDGSYQSTAASGGGGGGGGSPTVVNLVGTGTTYTAVVGDRIFLVDGGMAIDLTWLYTEPVGIEITVVNQDASTAATVASAYSGVYGSNSIAPQTAAKFITGANGYWHRVQ